MVRKLEICINLTLCVVVFNQFDVPKPPVYPHAPVPDVYSMDFFENYTSPA